jgi:phosphoadenosine phosphosulfate reductase
MLHLVTRIVPEIPVIWIDTGYLFPETYRFAEELTRRLRLNLHVYQSPVSPARMEALQGKLWQSEDLDILDQYDQLRKVEPMQRAVRDFGVRGWLAGLRRDQTDFRKSLPRIQAQRSFHKIFPILNWSNRDLHSYLIEHDLPYHPLFDRGYVSIGDWHSSEPLSSQHLKERDTRFRGIKQECGLHLDLSDEAAESLRSSHL